MRMAVFVKDFLNFFLVILLFSAFHSSFGSSMNIDYQCMDQKGQVRPEGAVWIAEGCRECVCMDGSVMCHRVEVDCPPRPLGKCKEIHGPCCPDWDCTMSGPDCSLVLCQGPPRPHCQPIIPEGECCAVDWICTGCRDPQGMPRDEGELWSDPSMPCTVCSCHEGIVECFRDECSCDPGKPECNPGCVDRQGAPRNEGEMWKDALVPCFFCSCEMGMVSCFPQDCPPPPQIPCSQPPQPDQCCPNCDPSLGYE